MKEKGNDELFRLFREALALRYRSERSLKEAERIITKFEEFLDGRAPSGELATAYLARFLSRKENTQARYGIIIEQFMKWYGDPIDLHIRQPKMLPQVVKGEDVAKLTATMASRKTHRKTLERDLLLVETPRLTGLRRGELANLKDGDLDFENDVVVVRSGKGLKDRSVPLVLSLRDRLEALCRGKKPTDSVFGLKAVSISGKVRSWAKKAGVPHIHVHSLRHHFGTELERRGVRPRIIQSLMGHADLSVTQRYLDVGADELRDAVTLLDSDISIESVPGGGSVGDEGNGAVTTRDGSRDKGGWDREPGPHRRELFHFGQRLRDRLGLGTPEDVLASIREGDHLRMWKGRPSPGLAEEPRNAEEAGVEREWGPSCHDARFHSLFPAFREHLGSHPCWAILEELEASYPIYEEACNQAYRMVFEELKRGLPDLRESDASDMAESLLTYAWLLAIDAPRTLQFSYEPKSVSTDEGIRYYLQLGKWTAGYEENPEALQPLARVHREICTGLPEREELKAVGEADMVARRLMQEFSSSLSPDALLRRLVMEGRCQFCR
jgi:integrase